MANEARVGEDTQELIKQTELSIKHLELKLKERELAHPTSVLSKLRVSPIEATMFVGVLAFFGGLVGTYIQERNKLALEQQKQEASLVLDALKGSDPAQNLSRLAFLIDTSFINDKNGAIRTVILSGKYGPVAAPSPLTLLDAITNGAVPQIISQILKTVEIPLNLGLREVGDFSPIAAVMNADNQPVLLYDKARIKQFDPSNSSSWTTAAILAHEIGHVVLGHMNDSRAACLIPGKKGENSLCKGSQALELEADRFSGQVLRRLGASLSQSEQALAFLPERASPTHPGRTERIQELLKGWHR